MRILGKAEAKEIDIDFIYKENAIAIVSKDFDLKFEIVRKDQN